MEQMAGLGRTVGVQELWGIGKKQVKVGKAEVIEGLFVDYTK